jgi:hypothetical protein
LSPVSKKPNLATAISTRSILFSPFPPSILTGCRAGHTPRQRVPRLHGHRVCLAHQLRLGRRFNDSGEFSSFASFFLSFASHNQSHSLNSQSSRCLRVSWPTPTGHPQPPPPHALMFQSSKHFLQRRACQKAHPASRLFHPLQIFPPSSVHYPQRSVGRQLARRRLRNRLCSAMLHRLRRQPGAGHDQRRAHCESLRLSQLASNLLF